MKKKTKILKKLSIGVVTTFALALIAIPVFAENANYYDSYLSISRGSVVKGEYRDYLYKNHSITMNVSWTEDYGQPHVGILLGKPGFWGFVSQARKVATYNVNRQFTTYMGSVGSGSKAYQFGTNSGFAQDTDNYYNYDGFNADFVRMKSYE